MRSRKGIEDRGIRQVLWAASHSGHSLARSTAANYEKYHGLSGRNTDDYNISAGEVPIGFVVDGSHPKGTIVRLRLADFPRHSLIIGPTGVGKTNLTQIIADGLMKHVNVMIFDVTGDHLQAYRKHNAIVFPIQNLRINPNEPPGNMAYGDWLEIYSSVLLHGLVLTDVSRGTFMQIIRFANEHFEGTEKGQRCSIYEQRFAIDQLKPRSYRDSARMGYWSRLEDRFDAMLVSALGQIFGCYRSHSLDWLLSRNIVFDCTNISAFDLKIAVSILLTKIYCYRLNKR